MTAQLLAELQPVLFSGVTGGTIDHQELEFTPVTSNGRVGIDMHVLYSADQTGPNGPAAALVRYAPGATVAPHRHPGFELIHVLSGVLVTDDGVYPTNSMIVMPPESVHGLGTVEGCLLLVVWEQPVELV
ncbi:hypothetical protein CFP65_1339 [Kitasatospora sp. MMS16-BH015]|uniref:cupin domain-containing protein n=1 Tax=Kitasatospora sp. MMS16-BH015 TaxID=2018025 RepID=UPI000CA18750|nr:cupin domain-containing protein [Kitasatospora sp. MMS16-BH015]AUG76238.1 hypothetical protein CFP65_1339 [Kitasatospora sp. MMS16-BH015]